MTTNSTILCLNLGFCASCLMFTVWHSGLRFSRVNTLISSGWFELLSATVSKAKRLGRCHWLWVNEEKRKKKHILTGILRTNACFVLPIIFRLHQYMLLCNPEPFPLMQWRSFADSLPQNSQFQVAVWISWWNVKVAKSILLPNLQLFTQTSQLCIKYASVCGTYATLLPVSSPHTYRIHNILASSEAFVLRACMQTLANCLLLKQFSIDPVHTYTRLWLQLTSQLLILFPNPVCGAQVGLWLFLPCGALLVVMETNWKVWKSLGTIWGSITFLFICSGILHLPRHFLLTPYRSQDDLSCRG